MSKGLVVCTYNRPNYLRRCLESIKDLDIETIVVVMDGGSPSEKENYRIINEYGILNDIVLEKNQGIGAVKNAGIQLLLELGCEHIFTLEEDNIITDPLTLNKYIEYAQEKGLYHLNFGLHGTLNTGRGKWVDWKGTSVWVYPDLVGSFSYYHKKAIEEVGLIDEQFYNAMEHVEHTWRIAEAELTTPFWWFADHPESGSMIQEIEGSLHNSTIRNRPDFRELIKEGYKKFIEKHQRPFPRRDR